MILIYGSFLYLHGMGWGRGYSIDVKYIDHASDQKS